MALGPVWRTEAFAMRRAAVVLIGVVVLVADGSAMEEWHRKSAAAKKSLVCPVMKSPIVRRTKPAYVLVNNTPVYVCCPGCIDDLKRDPAKYLKSPLIDPVSGKRFTAATKSPKMLHHGALFVFAGTDTHWAFHANPGKYARYNR